jgi:putative spermidine/putrescine transport system substrate-binding protein
VLFTSRPIARSRLRTALTAAAMGAAGALILTSCATATPGAGAGAGGAAPTLSDWDAVLADAEGQRVDLWMWGGDEQGNA